MELRTAQDVGSPRSLQPDADGRHHVPGPRRHHRDPVGKEHCFGDRVGDQQRGDRALRPDPLQLDVEALAGHLVEGAERFVEQQHLWVGDQRASNRRPLSHPPGQLRRACPLEPGESDEVDQRGDVARSGSLADDFERESDVALDRPPGQQRGVLEGDAEPAGAAQHRRLGSVHGDMTACRLVEVREDSQHRRLATSRRTEEGDELSAGGREVELVHGDDRAATEDELLAQAGDVQTVDTVRVNRRHSSAGRPSWASSSVRHRRSRDSSSGDDAGTFDEEVLDAAAELLTPQGVHVEGVIRDLSPPATVELGARDVGELVVRSVLGRFGKEANGMDREQGPVVDVASYRCRAVSRATITAIACGLPKPTSSTAMTWRRSQR